MQPDLLITAPNVSEGRDRAVISAVADARDGIGGGVRLLDVHSDEDHHRSVFTAAGPGGDLVDGLLAAASVAVERIDVVTRAGDAASSGQHPHVGAMDVAPIVYLQEARRGAACAHALVLAERIGQELAVPVFLYGELTAGDGGAGRTRAELRRGGVAGLRSRMEDGPGAAAARLRPRRMHPTAGATLVAARPPLVAFNLQLAAPATWLTPAGSRPRSASRGRMACRLSGRSGVLLAGGVAQVSMNVERPLQMSARRGGERGFSPCEGRQRRARRPRSRRCDGGISGGPADAGVRSRSPRDRERNRLIGMAQTKRKRQTKHRGNAAGVVESRGRTGRKPTADEKSGKATESAKAREKQVDRRDRPPTWQGAFLRAMFAAVLLLLVVIVVLNKPNQGIALFPIVLIMYVPISYYTDKWMYERRMRNKAKEGGGGKAQAK